MTEKLKNWPASLRLVLAIYLLACFFYFAFRSRHWEWMGDEQVFRYVQFLMSKGLAPYREITDINLPGSYLFEYLSTFFFGTSDLGFRFYEYTLLSCLTAASAMIARPYDWFAGIFSGVLFALIHGSEGPLQAGERDEVMTVLLLTACSLTFAAVRRRKPNYLLFSALVVGICSSIKPTAVPFGVILLSYSVLTLKKQQIALKPYLINALVGSLLIVPALLAFFLWRSSLGAFVHSILPLVASYSQGERLPFFDLLKHSAPRVLVGLLPVGLLLFILNRSWRNWESLVVASAALLGLTSYLLQGKGYLYQRDIFTGFALLWCSMEFAIAIHSGQRLRQVAGITAFLVGTFGFATWYSSRVNGANESDLFVHDLVNDLQKYPPESLQGQVQCLDGLHGCYSALYRLKIRQSTGLMGDHLLFTDRPTPPGLALRNETLLKLKSNPPRFIVLTNFWFGKDQSFQNLASFPDLDYFIKEHYSLINGLGVSGQSNSDIHGQAYHLYQLRP